MTGASDTVGVAEAPEPAVSVPGLGMIWAQDLAGGIGLNGDLPWHLPEDMAHFRRTTRGFPVLMGRGQWESLEPRFRPLPGRENIVLTRDPEYSAPGARVVGGLSAGLEALDGRSAWVIGGGQIYRQAMNLADELVVTIIDETFETDVRAPEIGPEWRVVKRLPAEGWTTAANGLRFVITRFTRA